ncbi:LysR family transcriptional regulator [Roseomonas rosulenta]|uniref:LysR family transcriptional regulator n=1 Tax=Roseomonas rosulenta TaxID=2748667 RepID=UPI0018DEF227|nr:LysR family transcriptional regulator [Roseomonas rosulenta]
MALDRLRAMEVFARVAERGSFRRAAEDLRLSNAMASTLVQGLERHLGVRLIARTTRRLALTEEGEAFLARCREMLAVLDAAEEEARGARGTARGLLRVQAPVAYARIVLAPALPRFLEAHPGLAVELSSRDAFPDFVAEGLDAAVYVGDPPAAGVIMQRLGRAPLATVAAPAYLAAHGAPATPADLARHRCLGVLSRETGRPLPWHFVEEGSLRLRDVPARLACHAPEAAVAAAVAGGGVLQMISYAVAAEVAAGALVPVLDAWRYPGPPVSLLLPARGPRPARLGALVAFLRALPLPS